MMSTSARAAALLTAALLVGSSATAATAAVGGSVRATTAAEGQQVRTSTLAEREQVPTSAAAAVTMTSNRKPKPAKGFHVVKELPHGARAGFSPARGELWLATGGGLEHLRAGRWTTETVPVGYASSFAGMSRDDVWLADGDSLLRYDGRRWTTVAVPTYDFGYSDAPWIPTVAKPWQITAVVSPRKGVLYAAANAYYEYFARTSVFRYAKGRWTDLGPPNYDQTREFEIFQMKVVDGALLTRAKARYSEDFDSYVDGTWSGLYSNSFLVTNFIISGWYPRSYSNHLILGGGFYGTVPQCARWIGAEPLLECTTTRVPAASAQLKNGSIVMAESEQDRPLDLSDLTQSEHVKANFGLRDVDGRETSLAGDPGDSTQFIVAEAHRNAAWAVTGNDTDNGWKYYLQRYDG